MWSEPVPAHHSIYLLFLGSLGRIELTELVEYHYSHLGRQRCYGWLSAVPPRNLQRRNDAIEGKRDYICATVIPLSYTSVPQSLYGLQYKDTQGAAPDCSKVTYVFMDYSGIWED